LPQALVKNRCSSKTGHGEGDAARLEHCGQGFAGKMELHPAATARFSAGLPTIWLLLTVPPAPASPAAACRESKNGPNEKPPPEGGGTDCQKTLLQRMMRGTPEGGSPPMGIVSSSSAGRVGRFREQRKHSAAILRIEKGPQTFFDNLSRPLPGAATHGGMPSSIGRGRLPFSVMR